MEKIMDLKNKLVEKPVPVWAFNPKTKPMKIAEVWQLLFPMQRPTRFNLFCLGRGIETAVAYSSEIGKSPADHTDLMFTFIRHNEKRDVVTLVYLLTGLSFQLGLSSNDTEVTERYLVFDLNRSEPLSKKEWDSMLRGCGWGSCAQFLEIGASRLFHLPSIRISTSSKILRQCSSA
jgi:hypothetical protein